MDGTGIPILQCTRGHRYFNGSILHYPRPIFDIGSITQNICLSALHYGLGTCIANQGITYPEVLHEFAGIPESKRIAIAIAIGYPNWDFPANKVVTTGNRLKILPIGLASTRKFFRRRCPRGVLSRKGGPDFVLSTKGAVNFKMIKCKVTKQFVP